MKNYSKNFLHKNSYIIYSFIFMFIIFLMSLVLKYNNLSLVYKGDALSQHFPSQFYIRKIIFDLFFNFGRNIKEINFNLGFGHDTLFTYYYYGLFDPLNLIMIPLKNINPIKLYSIRIFLRLYLSGIAFIYMCKYLNKNRDKYTLTIGAIIYVFSNYALSSGITHPYFAYSMILLPIMIVGVNKLIKENKKLLFIIISLYSIIINFYFAYIIAFEIFIYALVVIFFNRKKFGNLNSIKILFRGVYSYLIAILLSSAITIPMLCGILDSIRNCSPNIDIPLFTQPHILFRYFLDFFKIPKAGDAVTAGISVITLFTIIILFIQNNSIKNRSDKQSDNIIKTLIFITCLVIIFPKLQSIITGFSYAN